MVGLVISSVQQSKPLTGVVALLVVLVLATAVINGVQQYLLQRTAEGVVLRHPPAAGAPAAAAADQRVRHPPHR